MNFMTKTICAGLATISVAALSASAFAAPASATSALNVRTGPGTNFNVVDTLLPGEVVEVTECVSNGWCHIDQDGTNGWVSSSYLQAVGSGGGSSADSDDSDSNSDCSFGITIGPDGPKFELNCGDAPSAPAPTPEPEPAPEPDPEEATACFYTGPNYSGAEFCRDPSTLNTLGGAFNDRISSVQLFGGAKVKLCRNTNLTGTCRTYTNDKANLPPIINNRASSLAVFTGAAPGGLVLVPSLPLLPLAPLTPTTYSTGSINLKQTFSANLDNGATSGNGRDIWYEAENALQKFITPRSGAKLALGNGTNRGFAGCSKASFSSNRVSIWEMPIGTYVCAKTNQGRISQFRLNGYTGTTMRLGYTTWGN